MTLELPEDYKTYLRANVGALERLGDRLTGTDERIDYLIAQLSQVGLAPPVITQLRYYQLPLQVTVPLATALTVSESVPRTGAIRLVTISFPPGCAGLVGVRVGYMSQIFLPEGGSFLALDAAFPAFPFNIHVDQGESVFADIRNADVNPHLISILIQIEAAP